jgi:ABC-type Fe3+/spermidine/putrescine transport system ATPase subunit
MAFLEISHLSKSFDSVNAVDGVSLTLDKGELLCLLGPSGCGKTTLLRLVAGIEESDGGYVACDGMSLEGVPPHGRGFGLMFQDLALFPHMDVFGNVAFGLRMQRMSRAKVRQRVRELLALVGMADFAPRRVHELSGGERQRVALARALAPAPRLLMLDEPLGALDRALRDSLQIQIRTILKEVGVTAIYVTHDRDEALAVADTLAFMNRGQIVQSGTAEEVFRAPADEFVARTIGFKNILPGEVRGRVNLLEIHCDLGVVFAESRSDLMPEIGGRVVLLVDERGIEVRRSPDDGAGDSNVFTGTVTGRAFLGREYELKLRVGTVELSCIVPLDRTDAEIGVGVEVTIAIDPGAIRTLKSP